MAGNTTVQVAQARVAEHSTIKALQDRAQQHDAMHIHGRLSVQAPDRVPDCQSSVNMMFYGDDDDDDDDDDESKEYYLRLLSVLQLSCSPRQLFHACCSIRLQAQRA